MIACTLSPGVQAIKVINDIFTSGFWILIHLYTSFVNKCFRRINM